MLYFACHGGPDPRRPLGPLYLYTHDTDPTDVAGTGLPMEEIQLCLRPGQVRAERTVILVDTRHSGGVWAGPSGDQSGRSHGEASNVVSSLTPSQPWRGPRATSARVHLGTWRA